MMNRSNPLPKLTSNPKRNYWRSSLARERRFPRALSLGVVKQCEKYRNYCVLQCIQLARYCVFKERRVMTPRNYLVKFHAQP